MSLPETSIKGGETAGDAVGARIESAVRFIH